MEVILAVSLGFFLGVLVLFTLIILYGQLMTKPRDTSGDFRNPPGGEDNTWWGLYDEMDDEEDNTWLELYDEEDDEEEQR